MKNKLWHFIDNVGTFEFNGADRIKTLYFPLANEAIMSSVTADLHGDIKTGQNSFLLAPSSRNDLIDSRSSRNFWIYVNKDKVWSATGVSKNLKQISEDGFSLKAGLLWHKITRENKRIGLKAEILSFVPSSGEPAEVMLATITNISKQKIKFIPTAAIPVYARSADNLRDHRHVTSLLNRITLSKFGVITKPTLLFDESGHRINTDNYFVLGWDENFCPPEYIYPTQEMFCGDGGDLEAPASILNNNLPDPGDIQGREAMGGLRFKTKLLRPGESHSYAILMGISKDTNNILKMIKNFNSLTKIQNSLERTKKYWVSLSNNISVNTGNSEFDNWFRWVSIQPVLRRIYGCSFLPDFDYGKGGRGWRDLWQDCFSLILTEPKKVRPLLVNNFSGIRIDGSNATIIGKAQGEFIPDRNNISRVWMDHGVWPLLTFNLYMNETGDHNVLFEETTYFRDHQIARSSKVDQKWSVDYGHKLKTQTGKIYKGTVLEHLLLENLIQFFNVGKHNYVRLEGADWNDGLDMASRNGESVAFSCMYAYNLKLLSEILLQINKKKITVFKELRDLFSKIDYDDISRKREILDKYFKKTESTISSDTVAIDTLWLANNLKSKSEWMIKHISKHEWLKSGFFNGYYDNKGRRVEGIKDGRLRMILISQVFPIMSRVASDLQVKRILKSIYKYLYDKKTKSMRLNTDFRAEQHNLGRAFSFNYGDKENGAFFNHMIVMLANALYKRSYKKEGWQILDSIYSMAANSRVSKIYPCLPEYFNAQGRGMYAYLTGSASWFLLSMAEEAFGLRGQDGDLVIEPQFYPGQFKVKAVSIKRDFAGRKLEVRFFGLNKQLKRDFRILSASLNKKQLFLNKPHLITIRKSTFLALARKKANRLDIALG